MWRNLAKRVSSRKFNPLSSDSPALKLLQGSLFVQTEATTTRSYLGVRRIGIFVSDCSGNLRNPFVFSGFSNGARGYATAAEAIASTTESEEYSSGSDDMNELLERMNREAQLPNQIRLKKPKKMIDGIGAGKYIALKRRQIKMETEAWEAAATEYQELLENMCEQKLAPNLPFIKSLFLGWFEPLREAIAKEQEHCREAKFKPNYAPYIDQLPPEKMAVITMHKIMALLMTNTGGPGSCRVVQAASQLGEAIEHEARVHRFLEKTKTKKNNTKNYLGPAAESDPATDEQEEKAKDQKKLRQRVDTLLKQQNTRKVKGIMKHYDDSKPWGQEAHVKVGCCLVQLLTETAYVQPPVDQLGDSLPDIRPAFVHTLQAVVINESLKTNRRYGVIQCDPLITKGLEKTARHMVIPYMPMLVPPLKWTGYDKGAYFFLPSYVMRTHKSKPQRRAVRKTPKQQLEPVFEALDILGSTKWRVNKKVLDVIERLWANGGGLADLVDQNDTPVPEEPWTEDEEEMKKWRWEVRSAKKLNSEKHSQRCDIELKLAVARKMKSEDGFYYPHNLDFRGRAYPMHPHLNHLGSDLCRGILEFANGRPLGVSGLRWLKIHLANLYAGGVDKLSYEAREAFADNHHQDIFDSADMPLGGRQWWLGAEDPFQCLATCITLAEALRSSSPESTVSHIPIHQDGSCNGLQHYAALGRDTLGAEAVNLVCGEKPADVYSEIAARVHEIMRIDAKGDIESNTDAVSARLLVDQVDRKLVKQTVMTSVYGVTYIGARDQIKRRLKERGIIDDKLLFPASCYAARTTMTALTQMFVAAREIMGWLGDCAKVIAGENEAVQWTTPLGLPVVQPYQQVARHLVKTSLQVLTLQRETDKVMAKKHRTAFPPNFVHSLDGSHMMMTALACRKAGLDFAGVHDSYWTHACDVDEMNKILREKFVELYEAPILENLLESFQKQFPDLVFPPLPERGNFDLRDVLESPYFFN